LRLLDDAQLIKPNFMAGVPRVWNRSVTSHEAKSFELNGRINAAIKTQLAAGGLKGALLKKAVDAKLHNWRTTGEVTHRVYDALVFRKVSLDIAKVGCENTDT
jgi:long-chain acyl-CoA synthetase